MSSLEIIGTNSIPTKWRKLKIPAFLGMKEQSVVLLMWVLSQIFSLPYKPLQRKKKYDNQ
jgi:hypothetical protein